MPIQILQDDFWQRLTRSTEKDRPLPSGWWIIPGAIIGLLMWIGLFRVVFWVVGAV